MKMSERDEARGSSGQGRRDETRDPLAERLRRFSPDRSGLDRDALLFAAGRAAARPNRRWQALTAMLAACQLISLSLLWPRSLPTALPISGAPVAEDSIIGSPRFVGTDFPDEPGVLRAGMLTDGADVRPPILKGPLVPDEPPLRVFPTPEKSWN
jgi:hypothetical protein